MTRKPVPIEEAARTVDSNVLAQILGEQQPTVHVSEQTVAGLPAIGRGIEMVSNAVATMMAGANVYDSSGEIDTPPVLSRPNVLYGTHEFWQMVVQSLMYRGNFVGIKTDYEEGTARQIVPVPSDAVTLDISSGLPVYEIDSERYSFDDVIHVRANAPVGTLWGRGIVEQYRANLEG